MDLTKLGEPQQRAQSSIRTAFMILLEAAMDQLTGIEGVRELRPKVGEQLIASGEVNLGSVPEFDRTQRRNEAARAEYARAIPCGSSPPSGAPVCVNDGPPGSVGRFIADQHKFIAETNAAKAVKKTRGKKGGSKK